MHRTLRTQGNRTKELVRLRPIDDPGIHHPTSGATGHIIAEPRSIA